jgi:hypothetical protein
MALLALFKRHDMSTRRASDNYRTPARGAGGRPPAHERVCRDYAIAAWVRSQM